MKTILGNSGVKEVILGSNVTTIEDRAFYDCGNLISIAISENVTTIGRDAFTKCSGLTSIAIPKNVTSITGTRIFSGCTSLTSVYSLSETPARVTSFDNTVCKNATLYIPTGSLSAYEDKITGRSWKNFSNIVEMDLTGIVDVNKEVPAFEVTANGIQFTAAEGKRIEVYTANGALVEKVGSYAGEEITLDKGVYILSIGGKTVKVKL